MNIIGIDLGTTNSEVAAHCQGEVRVLGPGERPILPSCVGLAPDGSLLVGQPARNQLRLYPERTVRSIKRRMGKPEPVLLGEDSFSPPEISSLILRELARWAGQALGETPGRAVITVPAYFSDAQRNATREAGALAGLEVVRILNEPTAASLAYGFGRGRSHTVLVYDLGGGTFDVSVVLVEDEVTEVLASHGNNQLGGDDFDQLIVERLRQEFLARHKADPAESPAAMARLWWAAEEAKKRLSTEPFTMVREESLLQAGGRPLHLEMELTRLDYEAMILPLLEGTLNSVSRALSEAGKTASELDAILLVGGSTRTPLVGQLLQERTGLFPRQDVDPDLCVALGAGVLASRLSGRDVDKILVDVSPFSFGPSHLGEHEGGWYPYCYRPVIRRNTPLPVTRTESYSTAFDHQTEVRLDIFQGEDPDALKNVPVGELLVEGLKSVAGPNEVLVRMSLDLDGVLQVSATEKRTGLNRQVTIQGATRPRSPGEVEAARQRLEALFDAGEPLRLEEEIPRTGEWETSPVDEVLERSRRLQAAMHPDDAAEATELTERIQQARRAEDDAVLQAAMEELRELLYYVETA